MAQHQIKTKLCNECFVKLVSGHSRKAMLEKSVRGQHGNFASTQHFWHFCSILPLKWSVNPLLISFVASYKHRKSKIVSLWEKVKWNLLNWVSWLKLPKSSQKRNISAFVLVAEETLFLPSPSVIAALFLRRWSRKASAHSHTFICLHYLRLKLTKSKTVLSASSVSFHCSWQHLGILHSTCFPLCFCNRNLFSQLSCLPHNSTLVCLTGQEKQRNRDLRPGQMLW